jgi:hypothetical protein
MSTPVLLIIFKRPDLTKKVLTALSIVKPKTLLVAADGPRFPEEAEKCSQAKKLIETIDWDCDLHTNYSSENLGCGVRIYTAIDWAFSKFEELIILEDDCIPVPSFFSFCSKLLDYYRHDERIMHISGNNFQASNRRTEYSYYFSKYTHAWGWATWKRAWKHFEWDMKSWPEFKKEELIKAFCDDPYEQKYWTKIFDQMYEGAPDVWDYKWNYSCWAQNGLVILPNTNLVSNIGFGSDATHTIGNSPYMNLPRNEIYEIKHPLFIIRHFMADQYTFDQNFGGKARKEVDTFRAKMKHAINKYNLPMRLFRKVKTTICGIRNES